MVIVPAELSLSIVATCDPCVKLGIGSVILNQTPAEKLPSVSSGVLIAALAEMFWNLVVDISPLAPILNVQDPSLSTPPVALRIGASFVNENVVVVPPFPRFVGVVEYAVLNLIKTSGE